MDKSKIKFCTNHQDRKVKARGLCGSCYEKWLKTSNPRYAARQREISSRWHKNNRGRVKEYNRKRNSARGKCPIHRQKRREKKIESKYGISYKQWLGILERQGGGCAICSSTKNLHTDHCHNTGDVRGILCSKCNNGLGFFGDNLEGILRAVDYLRRNE